MLFRRHVITGAALGVWLSGVLSPSGTPGLSHPAAARTSRHPPHRKPARPDRRPLVLIDPGHGGKDPGCIGASGTFEKHIALAAARALRRHLQAGGRYRVLLTRDSDVFIPLQGRVEIARRAGAALFISLHANASTDRSAHGTCVYRFAWRASDARAASMAKWENSAERFEDPGLRGASRQVLHILATLMRRETQVHAAKLQQALVKNLATHLTMLPVPAPHARFAVLSAPDIPGVLVEMGFLTNKRDEAALRSPAHRDRLARSIRLGVDRYFAVAARP
ncbi:MAG: N-acetylmuramoyl-L-alanine amidase, partial [Rhodospirillales bacterium]|nr:N-acetylmuramoyl-L-alanine amidase [Rhodospirillales bacterium]